MSVPQKRSKYSGKDINGPTGRVVSNKRSYHVIPDYPGKPGPKKKTIDWEMVKRMAAVRCTVPEIAAVLGVTEPTLRNRPQFLRIYNRGFEKGKCSLRRLQYKAAETLNPAMLIWLGKQWLGQKDKTELSGPDGGPIQMQSQSINLNVLSVEDLRSLKSMLSRVQAPAQITAPQQTAGII